ncbi:MAG: A24 family peptidase [Ilumatobacteraceae bacterium]
MTRVIVGLIAGICAVLVAPSLGQRVTGVGVVSFSGSKNRRLLNLEVAVATVIFCAVFVSISTAIEGWYVVVAGWIMSLGLLSASWIDVHTHRLPRNLSYLTFSAGVPLLIVAAAVDDDISRLASSLIGIAVATILIGILYLVGRGAMGTGDLRLAPVIGLFAGWISVGTVLLALVASFLLAAVFALVLLISGRANRRDEFPLGPFLALGTIAAFVYAAGVHGL